METLSRLEIFAKRLTELRESHGMSKTKLAELLGVKEPNITRYENAEHGAKREQIERMSEIFNVSPAWIMGYDVPKYIEDKVAYETIPILGNVAAGRPLYAHENVVGYECIEDKESSDFCLVVHGDSMINAGIPDGSTVFIKQQHTFDDGQIVVALIDDEALCKRAYKENGAIVLRSDNPKYPPISITKKDAKNFNILGLVKYVKHAVY